MSDASNSQLLIDILRSENTENPQVWQQLQNLSTDDWEALADLASDQRIASLLHCLLYNQTTDTKIPNLTATRLANDHRAYTMHNMKLQAELACIVRELSKAKIPVIVLKGLYLASCVYPRIGQREMDDIDLLVPANSLSIARKVLMESGYTGPAVSDVSVHKNLHHHLPPLTKNGTVRVELHWNITRPGNNQTIQPDELWQRAVPINIAGAELQSLCPEDLLLHLCMHTSYQHQFAFGLRPFCDIATVIESPDFSINWDTLVSRAMRWKWQRGVYLSFRLSQILTDAQVPPSVLQTLEPAGFDEALCTDAWNQICTRQAFVMSIPQNIAQLAESKTPKSKVQRVLKSVFVPPERLAQRYNLPRGSKRAYLYYPFRLIYLFREHWCTLTKLVRPAENVKLLTHRTNRLAQWLNEDH